MGYMTEPSDGVSTAIQRETLRVAVRNSARSVLLLLVAVLYVAWLGYERGQVGAAALTLLLGLVVSGWRWGRSTTTRAPSSTTASPRSCASSKATPCWPA
jgi:hypothetical protein